jgi:hypothetical protein
MENFSQYEINMGLYGNCFPSGTNVIAMKYLTVPCFYFCKCDSSAGRLRGVSDFLHFEFLGNKATGTRSLPLVPPSNANVENAWHDATSAPSCILIAS